MGAYQRALEQHSRLLTVAGNWNTTRIEDITTLLRKTLLQVGKFAYQRGHKICDVDFIESARVLLSSIF